MRVLEHYVRFRIENLARDPLMQRVVPARVDGDVDIVLRQLPRVFPKTAEMLCDQCAPRPREGFSIEEAFSCEVLVVIADEQLERGARALCKPHRAIERRLLV